MTALPPPLPSRSTPAVVATRPRFGLPGWLIGLIVGCVLLVAAMVGAGALVVGWGWSLFVDQARDALQEQPVVQARIGQIREMHLDFLATGVAPGAEEFVFDLQGDRGRGRVKATFVSMGAAQEIITDGELTIDGRRYPLEDQSAADDQAPEDDGDGNVPDDDIDDDPGQDQEQT